MSEGRRRKLPPARTPEERRRRRPACKEGELGRRDGGEGEGESGPNNNYMILWD